MKGNTFDIRLSKDVTLKGLLKLPEFKNNSEKLLYFFNKFSIFAICFYLATFLIVNIFNIYVFSEVELIVYTYVLMILMSAVQLSKMILGGERYFGKTAFDILVLFIPPTFIIPFLLSFATTEIQTLPTFGTNATWHVSIVMFLALVILAYIIALNFSNKKHEDKIINYLKIGLILGLIFGLLKLPNELTVLDVKTTFMIILPGIMYSILNRGFKKDIIVNSLITILGIGYFLYIIFNQASDNRYTGILFLYLIIALLFTLNLVRRNIRSIVDSLKQKNFNFAQRRELLIAFVFIVITLIAVLANNYGVQFVENVINQHKSFVDNIESPKNFLIGSASLVKAINSLSIINAYGIVAFAIFTLINVYILFKLFTERRLRPEIKPLFLTWLMFILSMFILRVDTVFMLIYSIYLGYIMVKMRSEDVDIDSYQPTSLDKITNIQTRRILFYVRLLSIPVIFVIAALFISSLRYLLTINSFGS